MKLFVIIIFLSVVNLFASTIRIGVASNVSYAIDDLKKEFTKQNPNIKLQIILASTGKLTAQVIHGAPYDILMGANMIYPQKLYDMGYAITKPVVYARGTLACISSKKLDFSKGLKLFLDAKIKKIAIANQKTAPYGKATVEFLKNINLFKKLKKKFVYGESISQTLTYALKASDVGFVAKSLLFSSKMKAYKEGIDWISVNTKFYTPIKQGIVILKHAKNNLETLKFYHFMLGKEAENILKNYGYLIP